MIAFVSLFLGLVLGPQAVEVRVGDEVAAVEVFLDGALVGRREAPPWSLPCDLGEELAPHELLAVAYDAAGEEVGRVEQWINMPRPPAEATVVFEGGQGGSGVVARLSWESVVAVRPQRVTASFDGQPLVVTDPERIELPAHDPRQLHFFRAELDFSSALTAVVETTFGGTYADELSTRLTAVPILFEGRKPPRTDEMSGWLLEGGEALPVVAVDQGPLEVVVVRDQAAVKPLLDLERAIANLSSPSSFMTLPTSGSTPAQLSGTRNALELGEQARVRFHWPVAVVSGRGASRRAFIGSQELTAENGGLYWLLTRERQPAALEGPQRLADAVALAGMEAAGRKRRRAVLLVLSADPEDQSQLQPQEVLAYLRHLQVPLHVWVVGKAPTDAVAAWGDVLDVHRPRRLQRAARELRTSLEQQAVAWVDGPHLPNRITLSPQAQGVRLVR